MEFKKYQHLERFGTTEVQNIELGVCYIFPKLDGTNASVWKDENGITKAASRNRELTLERDNAGFYKWVSNNSNINSFLFNNPNCRLYGEWLVPHSLKTYRDDAWRKFYVFDVVRDDGSYVPYEKYVDALIKHGIDYVPLIAKIKNPSEEKLYQFLAASSYLIQDGKGLGEGIVIKNYEFVNNYGRTTWAKIVGQEFKDEKAKKHDGKIIEAKLVDVCTILLNCGCIEMGPCGNEIKISKNLSWNSLEKTNSSG